MADKTQERQLEIDMQHDIAKAFAGKLWCYVAVVNDHGSGLGVAIANERGYCPVPPGRYLVKDHSAAEREADRLNATRHIEESTALHIIGSTMAAKS